MGFAAFPVHQCWKMEAISSDVGQGWRVVKSNDYSVPPTEFLKTFNEFGDDADKHYGLPHPSQIFSLFSFFLLVCCLILTIQ